MIFFFNDTATTEIYTLSLHDALPISNKRVLLTISSSDVAELPEHHGLLGPMQERAQHRARRVKRRFGRSEEHTSELQSRQYLVCRLLLEKKNRAGYL